MTAALEQAHAARKRADGLFSDWTRETSPVFSSMLFEDMAEAKDAADRLEIKAGMRSDIETAIFNLLAN